MDKIDEQSVVDNSRHPVNRFSQPFGVVNPAQMKIDNVVPAVCHEERPVFLPDFRRIPGLFEFFQRVFVGEGYNFHRQREFSQLLHPFGGIRDDNDLSRKGGDDFLPQQRASAAFDGVKVLVDLIRAVDRKIDGFDLIDIQYPDSRRCGQFMGLPGGGDTCNVQACSDPFRQALDHVISRRPRAETYDHAVLHQLRRPCADQLFLHQLFLVHPV